MNAHETNTPRSESENGHSTLATAGIVGAAALVALGFSSRGQETPSPSPAPESYTDKAQNSAQQAYDPSVDELIIDGIRIKPGNTSLNSPSEAVLGNAEVATYIVDNPDEAASLEASSLALPMNASGEYVVVERDIDADGDTDAVAVPAGK